MTVVEGVTDIGPPGVTGRLLWRSTMMVANLSLCSWTGLVLGWRRLFISASALSLLTSINLTSRLSTFFIFSKRFFGSPLSATSVNLDNRLWKFVGLVKLGSASSGRFRISLAFSKLMSNSWSAKSWGAVVVESLEDSRQFRWFNNEHRLNFGWGVSGRKKSKKVVLFKLWACFSRQWAET